MITSVAATAKERGKSVADQSVNLSEIFPGIPEKDKAQYLNDGSDYVRAPELNTRANMSKGVVTKYILRRSKIFPGTPHDYWIYVPAQYRSDHPACLMVYLDGHSFVKEGAPTLMDNLIADRAIPVMIGLFADSGPVGPGYPIYGGKGNRAVEYDSANDELARYIVNELMPRVSRRYNINPDPGCHAILGMSSGGSAAFGVAWFRPYVFSKVISAIGSFVDIRGADAYPSLVRRADRKPIRVFLQDGRKDLDTVFGNWPLANKQMAAALAYRGYDYRIEFGEGGHNLRHFDALFGEAMKWTWRDWGSIPAVRRARLH